MTARPSAIRTVFLVLTFACGAAAVFPEIALWPVREAVSNMRTPDVAAHVARWIFAMGAVAFGTVYVMWQSTYAIALGILERIIKLPFKSFWMLVFVAALLPRLLVAATISYEPMSDAWWLHEAAASLAKGEGFAVAGELTAYRPPGYPFLLSLTYRLFGPDVRLAWFWGVLSTAIIVLAIHFIASMLYGAAVARLATIFAATYPALILMTGQSMSDLPFVAGLLALIGYALASSPYRLRDSIVIGIGIGMLTLTRGVAIGLFAVIPLIWLFQQHNFRRCTTSFVVMTVTFVMCITPWMLRNQAVFGSLTIGTNIGINAYIGNHSGAHGGSVARTWPPVTEEAEENEAKFDREMLRYAIDFVVSSPGEAAAIIPGKLLGLYLAETEAATSLFQGSHPSPSWMKYTLYGASQLVYVFLLICCFVRLGDLVNPAQRPRGAQWTGWLLAGYFTLICLLFSGSDRYRLPILPWILIEGAVVLARAVSDERRQGARSERIRASAGSG